MRARIKNVVTRLGRPGFDAVVGNGQTVIVPTDLRLTRFDRECGAWACCGYVHIADLKTCPVCGQSKETR